MVKKLMWLMPVAIVIGLILILNLNHTGTQKTVPAAISLWQLEKDIQRDSVPEYHGREDGSAPNPASAHGHSH